MKRELNFNYDERREESRKVLESRREKKDKKRDKEERRSEKSLGTDK